MEQGDGTLQTPQASAPNHDYGESGRGVRKHNPPLALVYPK
jgi:hypothetical protein